MYLSCPFCGFQINSLDKSCHTACPWGKTCNMICCPNCKYSFIEPESKIINTLKGLFTKKEVR
jgi:hypothetical protein